MLIAILAGCSLVQPKSTRRTELVFDTPCTVTVFQRRATEALDAVFEEIRRVQSIMNIYDPGSEISELNRHAGADAMAVSKELYKVIETGIAYGQVTGGAFDISIGPLVKLWDIGGEAPRVPSTGEIGRALALVEYLDILVLDFERRVLLKSPGMLLDLGGIAKGFAADRAAETLRSKGIERAIVDFGGNIFAIGEKESGTAWRIGVQHPEEPRGNYLGILSVRNRAVVTSGVYERYFEHEGTDYHHILDPYTGYPVDNGLVSVTIVAPSAMTADALSTAVFVLGIPAGITLVENFEGVEAVLVTGDRELYLTSKADALFHPSDETYTIKNIGGR